MQGRCGGALNVWLNSGVAVSPPRGARSPEVGIALITPIIHTGIN